MQVYVLFTDLSSYTQYDQIFNRIYHISNYKRLNKSVKNCTLNRLAEFVCSTGMENIEFAKILRRKSLIKRNENNYFIRIFQIFLSDYIRNPIKYLLNLIKILTLLERLFFLLCMYIHNVTSHFDLAKKNSTPLSLLSLKTKSKFSNLIVCNNCKTVAESFLISTSILYLVQHCLIFFMRGFEILFSDLSPFDYRRSRTNTIRNLNGNNLYAWRLQWNHF